MTRSTMFASREFQIPKGAIKVSDKASDAVAKSPLIGRTPNTSLNPGRGSVMTREFKVGERLTIYPTSDRTYTSAVTVQQVIPEGGAAGGGIVVVYDKPILGVRPTQTFRSEILAKRIKGSAA